MGVDVHRGARVSAGHGGQVLQVSVFRSWDFDAAVVVLFDDEFRVWRAARLHVGLLRERATFVEHVRGYRVVARDELLDLGEDWTARLREAAS